MKSILFLASILISSYANAALTVGDLARYQLTISTAAYSQELEEKIEVTAINASAGTYTSNITVSFNGMQISQTSEDPDLESANEDETTLSHCSEISGATLETITVIAGTFKVCHLGANQGGVKYDHYMGNVLFGIVKSITADSTSGASNSLELIQFIKH